MRLALLAGFGVWVGASLLLSELRWFSRRPLAERLGSYAPETPARRPRTAGIESFRQLIAPLATGLGERIARLLGVSESLDLRLARIHSPLDAPAFRVRQLGWAVGAVGVVALLELIARPPAPVELLGLLSAPAFGFLVPEQRLAAQSAARQHRVFLELPVVAEQLAMLLSAGYSLGAALNRLAARGKGACADDLRAVTGRMRQGLTEGDALREWAAIARVDALDRLVSVLALNREAADLGRLISEEARSIRKEVHRQLVATMDRRAQQVWIPVTVATLVPGVIFLAVPFIEALRLFSRA